jgi:hypothetical protein
MRWNIQNWIEEVKTKPEHIRHRYVIGCVATSMFFIIIVWSLTVSEAFKETVTTTKLPDNGGILPKASDFSLDRVLSGQQSLTTEEPKTSEVYLREKAESLENRTRLNLDEEGLKPKEEKTGTEAETMPIP